MENSIEMIVTIVGSVIASSGFWTYVQRKYNNKDLNTQMLIGLGHDRIIYLGLCYIDRGWVTQDEYENLHDYLYEPYSQLGGNGSAKKIIEEVNKLPIRKVGIHDIV